MNELNFPAPLRECFADVYEPSEDSFFLLDILENDLFSSSEKTNRARQFINIVLEICCGRYDVLRVH